ncbi:choice-of-anchor I family protein [Pseudonocardia sp.]|uniref:choice-of-anchor I family protein n=1 Tax=Pseudonocardia sp. TaxID=60912 RepID=UPI002609E640|nr:choice-of-anchor I family protein [Pseudonocardia sp.]
MTLRPLALAAGLALALPLVVLPTAAAGPPADRGRPGLQITELGRYTAPNAEFDAGGAEIVAHDPGTQRLFVVNGSETTLDVIDIADPAAPTLVEQVDLSEFGTGLTGVGSARGLVGVATGPDDAQSARGTAVFLDARSLQVRGTAEVGFLPDALLFSPDGRTAVVANEGEPSADYSVDPEGSVSLIDVRDFSVREVGFGSVTEVDDSTRIFGPGASIAQDVEPENIAFSHDSRTAWVSLQENNALAVIDLRKGTLTDVVGLGFIDRNDERNAFDASNDDGEITIRNWDVLGIPMPDSVSTVRSRGQTFVLTANEGDARDYETFSEEERVADVALCAQEYPDAAELQLDENLGRLNITTVNGFDEARGCFAQLHAFGGRSFSAYTAGGEPVYDSGSDFERITAEVLGRNGFNANNDESGPDAFDSRSDDKGPEPEGMDVGTWKGRTYAFVGLERVGGFMTYDVTDPRKPVFVAYTNGRDFGAATAEESIDLGPEGVLFVEAKDSPTKRPLVVLSHEVSASTTIYGLG